MLKTWEKVPQKVGALTTAMMGRLEQQHLQRSAARATAFSRLVPRAKVDSGKMSCSMQNYQLIAAFTDNTGQPVQGPTSREHQCR